MDYEVLKFIWWVLIGVLLIGFAIMDGYDMGTANLLPFMAKNDTERRIMINAIAPHWDGNQVWLVAAGGAIFAAWPIVYATAFSGFYWAMVLVLYSLLIRPMAMDYRSKLEDPRWRKAWDWGLFASGAIPTLVFGVAFGNLFQGFGFELDDTLRSSFSEGLFDLLNPFAILCGLVSVSMLTMHGAVWQGLRAGAPIQQRAGVVAQYSAIVAVALFTIGGFWIAQMPGYEITSNLDPAVATNPLNKTVAIVESGQWIKNYSLYPITMVAPVLAYIGGIGVILLARTARHGLTFVFSCLVQIGVILTAGFSLFPFILPSSTQPDASLTIWDATSSQLTLGIMTFVAALFVPIILGYTIWCFYKLWGRVTAQDIAENNHSLY